MYNYLQSLQSPTYQRASLVPRFLSPPDHLQHANTEGEGLADLVMCVVSVSQGRHTRAVPNKGSQHFLGMSVQGKSIHKEA